ncbi:MAG: hypothetical protein WCO56_23205 [Verrucomicrobiota bacterium]
MTPEAFESQLKTALSARDKRQSLTDLARTLKSQGVPQAEVYELYRGELRKNLRHADVNLYELISETMDAIAGRCDKSHWIFEDRL